MVHRRRLTFGAATAASVLLALGLAGAPALAQDSVSKKTERVASDSRRLSQRAPDLPARGAAATSRAGDAELAAVQNRIADYVAKNGTRYSFGSWADPATGDIVLQTDAPSDVVATVTGSADTDSRTAASAQSAVGVTVQSGGVSDNWNRRDDLSPYYGGGGIYNGGGLCSNGYAVKNAAGTRYMVTAGHCFADGANVLTESQLRSVGTVSGRTLASLGGGPRDMELIGGQSYNGRVFSGGVTSTTSHRVVGAGNASVGYTNYCHSGRTTGENCGHTATSVTGQVCTQTGCKSPVIVYTGGTIQQGGDSGGAFYAKSGSDVWIRGHVIASGGGVGYVERWDKVASRYGVSIVTG